jgi:hypothetical protein
MNIYLSNRLPNKAIVYYALQLVAFNKGFEFHYTSEKEKAEIAVGVDETDDIVVSRRFYDLLSIGETSFKEHLDPKTKTVINELGETDYFSTIFYYVNCTQEFFSKSFDCYGRFKYQESLQHHFQNIKENFVQRLIDECCEKTEKLCRLKTVSRKSACFLTHDIDEIFKAKNEDGKFALLKGKWLSIPRLIWNHYCGTPDLLNMKQIAALELQFGFRSTFFWLPVKNKQNADYELNSPCTQEQISYLTKEGFAHGIHKSWSEKTFEDELSCFYPHPSINRYHFLKFTVHDFLALEAAGIRIDTSLGYAEQFGFRNNYGLPFHPFDLTTNRVVKVLEVPMQVMDRTFYNNKMEPKTAAGEVLKWMQANESNCVFTINWHNNFFTELKYEGYREFYVQLLEYLKSRNMRCYLPDELEKDFFRPEFFSLPHHLQ